MAWTVGVEEVAWARSGPLLVNTMVVTYITIESRHLKDTSQGQAHAISLVILSQMQRPSTATTVAVWFCSKNALPLSTHRF
jgi:hypothetical protein